MTVNDAFAQAMIVAATRCTSGFLGNEISWTWSTTPPPVDKCFSIRFSAATKANAFFSRCYRFLASIHHAIEKRLKSLTNNAQDRVFFAGRGVGDDAFCPKSKSTCKHPVCASTVAAEHFDEVTCACSRKESPVRVPTHHPDIILFLCVER